MIWVFGDSFFEPDSFWLDQLSVDLDQPVLNYALGGTSLGYTFYQYDQYVDQFSKDDIVIVGLTVPLRRYFFHDRPETSTALSINWSNVTSQEKAAIMMYTRHLINDQEQEVLLKNFLYRINNDAYTLGIQTLVFRVLDQYLISQDSFEHIHIVNGFLYSVSHNEVAGSNFITGIDPRSNHMSYINHTILSKKVYDFLMHNTPIVLDCFKEKFLTIDTLEESIGPSIR